MGWSTELFCNISFNRKSYNSLYEVESDIDELKKEIGTCKDSLQSLVFMTEPDKFYNKEEYDSALSWVRSEYDNNMSLLEELQYELFKLEYLRDNWKNCHNDEGLAIPTPDDIKWDTAYLEGDFVRTTKNKDLRDELM